MLRFAQLAFASAFLALPAASQVHVPVQDYFESTSATPGGKFGSVIATEGDLAAVGSLTYDADVQLFRRVAGQWTFEQAIKSNAGDPHEAFGSSLAIAGGRLFVGARFANDVFEDAGAVYIFEHDGASWNQVQKVVAPGPTLETSFGATIAATETTLVVGAPFTNATEFVEGAVYTYRNFGGTWLIESTLISPDPSYYGAFGTDVKLVKLSSVTGEESLVIGAPGENGAYLGRIYVYRRLGGTWLVDGVIEGADSAVSDQMGSVLAASGNVIAASSLVHSSQIATSGAVYLFRRSETGWAQEQKLILIDPHSGDTFGRGLALDGDHLIVGAPNAPVVAGPGQVAHFHFDGATWIEAHRWVADPILGGTSLLDSTWFGYSVALAGDQVLSGAARAFTSVETSGLMYTFDLTPHALEASSTVVAAGEPLTLTWAGGSPGGLAALVLRDVNGIPLNWLLHVTVFEAAGSAQFTTTVPPGLAGLTLTFEAGGHYDLAQTIQGSNLVDVTLP